MSPHSTLRHARPGDWIEVAVIGGGAPRRGQIVAVLGEGTREHYRVRWDEQHESLHYPSDGSHVLTPEDLLHPTSGVARVFGLDSRHDSATIHAGV
jgi:hypothetical protein